MAEERTQGESNSDTGSDSINPFAVLGIGEALIRYCNGIRIKDHPFYVILSNKRIIIIDTYVDNGVAAKEIPLHTINNVEQDPGYEGTGASLILSVYSGEDVKQMRYIFSGSIGGVNECIEWNRALRDLLHLPEPEFEQSYSPPASQQARLSDAPSHDDAVYIDEGPGHEPFPIEKSHEIQKSEVSSQVGIDTRRPSTRDETEYEKDFIPSPPPRDSVQKPGNEAKPVKKRKVSKPVEVDIIDGETGEGVDIQELKQPRGKRSDAQYPARTGETIQKTQEKTVPVSHDQSPQYDRLQEYERRDSEPEPNTLIIHVEKPVFRQHRLRRSYLSRSVSEETDIRPCSVCGVKIPLKARFCPSCGSEQG